MRLRVSALRYSGHQRIFDLIWCRLVDLRHPYQITSPVLRYLNLVGVLLVPPERPARSSRHYQ